MMFALALLALLPQPPAAAPEPAPPPEEMIDFLGRRRLCLELAPPAERNAFEQAEGRRLACDALPSEERHWRDHYRGNVEVSAWLDQDPRNFRLPVISVSGYDGPPAAYVHRMEWTGTESRGPAAFHLAIDTDAENGAATLFTASYGDVPARTFRIDNARFPWLDLQSVTAHLGSGGARDYLHVDIRFGYRRGYCALLDEDDRPRLSIVFHQDRVSASYQDRTNCRTDFVSLTGPD
jgi:hypothetical protein